MEEEIKNIQIRMREHTIHQMDKMKEMVKCPGRSETVRRAMDIADMVITSLMKGDRVIIESGNGKQKQIIVSGVNA